jgi:ABC-type polysaccharide/polyol phosphate transport system ATPase subunit
MKDVLVVKQVSKYYGVGINNLTLLEALKSRTIVNTNNKFTALDNINFNLEKGQAFGIIGKNGSGKSTLLQIIAGTLRPDKGTVQVGGRISALLELGSGFNPEFTGIENIYLSGSILGISRSDMDNKLTEIISFADIGDFINEPVRTYSSGMLMRVAFSVAVAVEPDLLIIDEALSVGDILFQQKCNARLRELLSRGVTLLVVTHDTSFVLNICKRALWLHQGKQMFLGNASECVQRYLAAMAQEAGNSEVMLESTHEDSKVVILPTYKPVDLSHTRFVGDEIIKVNKLWILNESNETAYAFRVGSWCRVVLSVLATDILEHVSAGCELRDRHGQVIFATGLRVARKLINKITPGFDHFIEIKFQTNLAPGQYTLDVGCGSGIGEDVKGSRYIAAAIIEVLHLPEDEVVHGLIRLPHSVDKLRI